MTRNYSKIKKIFFILLGSIIAFVILIILLISPITKYLIEKYDEKYTGRQIKISWIYVNPFTGYFYARNLKVFELKTPSTLSTPDSIFFSAEGVAGNFALFKMFFKDIELSNLTLNQPKGIVIQHKKEFNFDDLVKKFSPEKNDTIPSNFHFSIRKIIINDGIFFYRDNVVPIEYAIKKVNIESDGYIWDVDTIAAKFSFISGVGKGSANGLFSLDLKKLDYHLVLNINKFDLNIIEQYLKDLVNYGYFSANLDADIKVIGNFSDKENVNANGIFAINDFHIGKNRNDDYASFEKLSVSINAVNPKNNIYIYDSISLVRPYFKYEKYDYLDNLQNMFGKDGNNISEVKANSEQFNLILEIADYVKLLAKNFFKSNYKINRIAIYNGAFRFNDYSLSEKFSIEAKPFNFLADSVMKNKKWVDAKFNSYIQPYGNISVNLRINPSDSLDFDLSYHLKKLPTAMFNPYLIAYSSFPVDRGTLDVEGSWNVRNGIISSNNHLVVIDPRVGKRLKNKDNKWIPLPLIMSLVRERGNVIDYEIPITGNLKNPKFHWKDVVFDVLSNIFIKPATTPYRMQVKNIENEIEKSLTLKWKMRQNSLYSNQENFIEKMVDFLINNPDASLAVYPLVFVDKEKEYISFFEAKKRYYLFSNKIEQPHFTESDSLSVDKMSVKDTLFLEYLNKQINTNLIFTVQEKCNKFIGLSLINNKLNILKKEREIAFLQYFIDKNVDNRVKIYKSENTIPYNGFSFYKIIYKGEFPESLIDAYKQMDELNNLSPRKLFKKDREKNKSNF